MNRMNRRRFLQVSGGALGGALLGSPGMLRAQGKRLSIATGGTGGVFYVMGGGIASILTKTLPNIKVTAEATAAAVDNCKLIGARKADLAFSPHDVGYDAYVGRENFKAKVPLRALLITYANYIHFVASEGSGVKTLADLRGKKVSLGAPGSGTEVKAGRILEAIGIDPAKDIKRDRLSVAESCGAIKDRKIDAFCWSGGLPTAAIMDLAATPGVRIRILDMREIVPKLKEKFGPVYFLGTIPKGTYPGMDYDAQTAAIAVGIVVHEKMEEDLAYQLVKTIIEKKPELVLVHKEAEHISLQTSAVGSAIPYHPGSIRFFKEKGITPG
ncbi:MAG TPA: TAXI family TRAP transporter solute-binding subunit [Thermodesulfobacteriota bacterium]|nr:TAXI family TRAP transporter solute-binding subunit [Thermodesulfobacteriota bacterium]